MFIHELKVIVDKKNYTQLFVIHNTSLNDKPHYEVIGVAHFEYGKASCFFYRLYVAPDHRNKGIASALINHAIGLARKANCKTLSLVVSKDNEHLIEFYEKLGFYFVMDYDDGDFLMYYQL